MLSTLAFIDGSSGCSLIAGGPSQHSTAESIMTDISPLIQGLAADVLIHYDKLHAQSMSAPPDAALLQDIMDAAFLRCMLLIQLTLAWAACMLFIYDIECV